MKKSISVQTDRYKFDMQICKGPCVPNVGESYSYVFNLFKLSNNCNVHTIFRVIKLSSKQGRNNIKNI